ncbi:MAG: hypothetical protein J0H88_08510 [Sphingomonadales bacterium]|nr:hypothetical protein [Sphingomonadales bacterium]
MTEVSTRERAGAYDALETAKEGEPIFVMQGGDALSPPTILHYAGMLRRDAMSEPDRATAEAKLHKATNAEIVAWSMKEYQRGEAVAAPIKPKGYNGIEPDASRSEVAQMSALADRVYNAIAELSDVGDVLSKLGGQAAAELKLRDAIVAAGEGVKLVEPRKHLPRVDEGRRELLRIAAADTMVAEPFRDRRSRLINTVRHSETRLSALREAIALADGFEVLTIAGIAFTAEEVQLLEREMVAA